MVAERSLELEFLFDPPEFDPPLPAPPPLPPVVVDVEEPDPALPETVLYILCSKVRGRHTHMYL